jgi:hypothetical protein
MKISMVMSQAQDLDGDGIVDIEEPGDQIRAWRVEFTMGTVPVISSMILMLHGNYG